MPRGGDWSPSHLALALTARGPRAESPRGVLHAPDPITAPAKSTPSARSATGPRPQTPTRATHPHQTHRAVTFPPARRSIVTRTGARRRAGPARWSEARVLMVSTTCREGQRPRSGHLTTHRRKTQGQSTNSNAHATCGRPCLWRCRCCRRGRPSRSEVCRVRPLRAAL